MYNTYILTHYPRRGSDIFHCHYISLGQGVQNEVCRIQFGTVLYRLESRSKGTFAMCCHGQIVLMGTEERDCSHSFRATISVGMRRVSISHDQKMNISMRKGTRDSSHNMNISMRKGTRDSSHNINMDTSHEIWYIDKM